MRGIAILSFLIFISLSTTGFCFDYYVDITGGSDITGDGEEGNPWKTITFALSSVKEGELEPSLIHVSPGVYNSEMGEIFPLVMKNNVILKGVEKETTILDGTGITDSVIYCGQSFNLTIRDLTITGGSGTKFEDS